jgi:tetratricopeptide (TPR) repeat protein
MPRPIPPRHAVALAALRLAHGWPQGELGAALGPRGGALCDIEKGRKPISRERLLELVAPLGAGPEEVDLTLFWLDALYGGPPAAAGPPFAVPERERRLVKQIGATAAQAAFGEAVARLARARQLARARRERERAPASLDRLLRCDPARQRLLVAATAEYRSFALCELVCEESVRWAPKSAPRALALADLALHIAEHALGGDAWRARIQGYAWAFAGNARRVAEDLRGAREAFERSRALWAAGAEADPGVLDASRVPDLEASLLRDARRFEEALERLDLALDRSPSTERTASILLKRSSICEQMGDCDGSIDALRKAAPLIDAENQPRQLWLLRFNLGVTFCHLGRHAEAAPLVTEARELAIMLRNESDVRRVLWLDARVDAGLGHREEATAKLRQVRRELVDLRMAYDAALATLDLAVVLLEDGKNAEVCGLAAEMLAIFESLTVYREAFAAVRVFWQAVEGKTATAELGRRLLRFLERARRNPELRFHSEHGEASG